MNAAPFLSGQFLLAMPGMGDPRFDQAVIAMCSHDEKGALGVAIGSALPDISLFSLLDQFEIDREGISDAPIHWGGPVEPTRGFVLHSKDWGGQGTLSVADRWCLSSSIDVLKVLGRANGPSRWLLALGYAGWGAGQLEGELTRHGWHVATSDFDALHAKPAAERWSAAFRLDGIDPRLLSAESGHA